MKELKKYKCLIDKKKELEIKLQAPRKGFEENIEKEFNEVAVQLNKYEVAFQLLTEREQQIVRLRYEQQLSFVTVINILYISKSAYYEAIRSIEIKIHSFFEGAKLNTNLEKL